MFYSEMKKRVAHYQRLILQQRLLAKKMNKDKAAKIHLLNLYAGAQSLLPPGFSVEEYDIVLANKAQAVLLQCESLNRNRDALRAESFRLLCDALTAIGQHYGNEMAADPEGTVRQRFRKRWNAANKFRQRELDGVCLHGLLFDENGPMFKAFARAAGFRKVADLKQTIYGSMRN